MSQHYNKFRRFFPFGHRIIYQTHVLCLAPIETVARFIPKFENQFSVLQCKGQIYYFLKIDISESGPSSAMI